MEKNNFLREKKFDISVLGCRTNLYEAEALVSMLEARGARYSPGAACDFFVAVTCSVTAAADAKARKLLRRIKRRSPAAALVACGCFAQSCGEGAARELGVDILVGNRRKENIPDLLERWFGEKKEKIFLSDVSDSLIAERAWDSLSLDRPRLHTRAFVKVQDGCSRRCSYCVVPRVRGMQVSRDPLETADEISRIVSSGCREVVLTGIHLGGYRSGDVCLGGLIRRVSRIPGLARLRMGSIEPFAVDDGLLEALAASEIFCPHIHLPLQSGDDGVLAAMRRGYTASDFARTVERVRRYLGDDAHVSTDLIVGFPGESDAAFARSLALLSSLEMGKIHVFPFSPRAGTEAAEMPGRVPGEAVSERTQRALALSDELLGRYAARFVGAPCELLVEEERGGIVSGWTRHYLKACAVLPERLKKPEKRGENLGGCVFSISPKAHVGGILLEEGIDPASAASFAAER